jgi:hypothetical protein
VLRVVKVVGVGVTVEVGLHGVKFFFGGMVCWVYAGAIGEGSGRRGDGGGQATRIRCLTCGVAPYMLVDENFGGKEVGKSDVTLHVRWMPAD